VLQAASLQIEASQEAVKAALVQCSGAVRTDTAIAGTVTAATFTQGIGNV